MRSLGQRTWGERRVARASFQALQLHGSEEEGQILSQDTTPPPPPSSWALEARKWTRQGALSCLMDSPWSGSLLDLLLNLVPCYWWSVCFLGVMLCFSPTRSAPELPGRGSQSSSGVFYRFTFKVQDGLRVPASPFLCAPSWGARRTRKAISSLRLGTQMEKVLHLSFSFSLCQEHWLLLPAVMRSGCSEQEVVLWVCQGRTPQCGPTLPRISSGRLPPSTWYLVAIQNYLLNGCIKVGFSRMCFSLGQCDSVAEC